MSTSVTADEVLELRKKYKRAKNQYRITKCTTEVVQAKPKRKPRDPNRVRSDKEKANDERLKARTTLAKEIRAANPTMLWTEAIKQATEQMKQP